MKRTAKGISLKAEERGTDVRVSGKEKEFGKAKSKRNSRRSFPGPDAANPRVVGVFRKKGKKIQRGMRDDSKRQSSHGYSGILFGLVFQSRPGRIRFGSQSDECETDPQDRLAA